MKLGTFLSSDQSVQGGKQQLYDMIFIFTKVKTQLQYLQRKDEGQTYFCRRSRLSEMFSNWTLRKGSLSLRIFQSTEMRIFSELKSEQRPKKLELWDSYKRYNVCVMGITKGEGKKREEIFKIIMTENFPKINVRYQKKLQLGFLYFEYDMPKSKKKILKQAKGKIYLTYRGARIKITSNFS